MNELSSQDVVKPFDLTGLTSITAPGLEQSIDGITPYLDKGLFIVTFDVAGSPTVPDASDATGTTKWQRFGWIRMGATDASLYIWNTNWTNDTTYRQWIPASSATVPDLSLTTAKYGFQSVTDEKIASVNWNKLIGTAPTLAPSGAAGGDLTGTYPNPTIAANAVDGTKLKSDAVSANRAVGALHVQDHSLALTRLAVNGTALTVPLGAADLSGFVEYSLPQLQFLAKTIAAGSATTIIPFDTSVPDVAEGDQIATLAITPKSATTIIRVRVAVFVSAIGVNYQHATLAIFKSGTAAALNATTARVTTSAGLSNVACLLCEAIFVPGATTALTITARLGPSDAGTIQINKTAGTGGGTVALFGAAAGSFMTVEEMQGTLS